MANFITDDLSSAIMIRDILQKLCLYLKPVDTFSNPNSV